MTWSWVPLEYQLQTGDTVEIITSVNQKPSEDRLKYVKTSRASRKIRRSNGDYEGAEPLLRRALEIKDRVLGPDHPDTASGLNYLAGLINAQSGPAVSFCYTGVTALLIPGGCVLPACVQVNAPNTETYVGGQIEFFEGARRIGTVLLPTPDSFTGRGPLAVSATHNGKRQDVVIKASSSDWNQSFSLPLSEWDHVSCSVFSPPEIAVGNMFMVQVFVHFPSQMEQAYEMANEADDEAERRGVSALGSLVAREVPR